MARAPRTSFDVSVRKASLRYAGAFLFDRLDFTLPAGQWTCLLGPSGVGKTSLLRLIAGLVDLPDAGDRLQRRPAARAPRLAWMAQQDNLLPWLTVLGNVPLGARLRGEIPAA